MLSLFFSKEGKHIVCGGTTSEIAARYLGTEVIPNLDYLDPEIPPTAEIAGVDLVTEGVVTMSKVLTYAKDYLADNESYKDWSYKKDGASQIARLLFEEATDINFYVGRAINPHIIEGQMHGSCSMGQGYALTEGYPTKNGYPVKTLYRQLGLPRAEDTPDYEIILIEDPEPQGPFGAKGISEVATVPVTPAILNAVSRAIGVRINKVPASPEVVLEAIRTGKCDVPTMEQQIKELEK